MLLRFVGDDQQYCIDIFIQVLVLLCLLSSREGECEHVYYTTADVW